MTQTSDTTTNEAVRAQLARWRAMADAATSGPWEVHHVEHEPNELGQEMWAKSQYEPFNRDVYDVVTSWIHGQAQSKLAVVHISMSPYYEDDTHQIHWMKQPADPEFVAMSRTALPLLLDALEAAMGALEFYADVDSWRGDGYPLYEETGTAQRALAAIAATLEGE